jgi:hypothetical protein
MSTDDQSPSAPEGLAILAEMDAWRATHPTATLTEIEAALDDRLSALRRQLLSHTIAKSPLSEWSELPPEQRPLCPSCAVPLQPRGQRRRHLHSAGGELTLDRTYGICPRCGSGLFPPR